MEEFNNHSNDQQKRKENTCESILEEGEITKFSKSRFFHNKVIITHEINKDKETINNFNTKIRCEEDHKKIEKNELIENNISQQTNIKEEINPLKNTLNEVNLLCYNSTINNPNKDINIDIENINQNAFNQINSIIIKDVTCEKLINQNDNNNNLENHYLNKNNNSEEKNCEKNQSEEEDNCTSEMFTIPIGLDRETEKNISINTNIIKNDERSGIEINVNSEIKNEKEKSFLNYSQKEEGGFEKSIKEIILSDIQIIDNKEIFGNKNLFINDNSLNLNEINKNCIKIKILDDDNIPNEKIHLNEIKNKQENITENKVSNDKETSLVTDLKSENIPINLNNFNLKKNENLDFNNKEEIINNPIVEYPINDPNEKIEVNEIEKNFPYDKKIDNIPNIENENFVNNQINLVEKKNVYLKENYESDKDIISNLISYKNQAIVKLNTYKNSNKSTEKLDSNNLTNSKNENINRNNNKNDSLKQQNMEFYSEAESNKETLIKEEITNQNLEEIKEKISKENNQIREKEKEKKSKKCEKKVICKNCIYCKIEITDPSSILKFKSSDDFLTYCKLFFEKIPSNKKEIYSKSIASFEKYYTEKYSNFEQINNIIFKSIKAICKKCYEENIKEENGFINILAALNYNIILNNKKNQIGMLNFDNRKETQSIDLNENNFLIKDNMNEIPKLNSIENNKDFSLSASKNNYNIEKNDIKSFNFEKSNYSNDAYIDNYLNKKRNSDNDLEKQKLIKSNSLNSEFDNIDKDSKYVNYWNISNKNVNENAFDINNNLLSKKKKRSEQEFIASMCKKTKTTETINNSDKIDINYPNMDNNQIDNKFLYDNFSNYKNQINSIKNPDLDIQMKALNSKDLPVNKHNSNSNLNMNTKNISLENLNITNVFMNFDKKKGIKPILIDSKMSNNDDINTNNKSKINKNISNNTNKPFEEINANYIEDLEKSYNNLYNSSIEKKQFLNSLHKKSENLITSFIDFEKNKSQGFNQENALNNGNIPNNEKEKMNFSINNSHQMGLFMNSLNQQLDENKNTLCSSKNEIRDFQTYPNMENLQMSKNINVFNNHNLKNNSAYDCKPLTNNMITSFNLNLKNNNNDAYDFDYAIEKEKHLKEARDENQDLNMIEKNSIISNQAQNYSMQEKEKCSKKFNKPNLIDRILNPNNLDSKIKNINSGKNNSGSVNITETSSKNVNTISEDTNNKINNKQIHNNRTQINNNGNEIKKLEEIIKSEDNSIENNNMQQTNYNMIMNRLMNSANTNYNNIDYINLQQMLLNQQQEFKKKLLGLNNRSNDNFPFYPNYSVNNSSNLEPKKQSNENHSLGHLNVPHINPLQQSQQLLNHHFPGLMTNSFNNSALSSNLLPGIQGIPNLTAQSNQQLFNFNPLMNINHNLMANLDPISVMLQNQNISNQNLLDSNVLGIANNPLLQLQLPLQYQMQINGNPDSGLSLPLLMQMQNPMQMGNLGNMRLNQNNQTDILNKLNMGGHNIHSSQDQQINSLKSNNNQQNIVKGNNRFDYNIQQNMLKSGLPYHQQIFNMDSLHSQDVNYLVNQLNNFEKNNTQGNKIF